MKTRINQLFMCVFLIINVYLHNYKIRLMRDGIIFMFKKYCYENNFTFVYFVYVPAMCSSGQGKGQRIVAVSGF